MEGLNKYDEINWDIYHRISDGRSTWEPLVFTGDWVAENIVDEDDHASMMSAMEKDMRNRGLCPDCGRPDLRGVHKDQILTPKDYEEMAEMWAIEAQERRMGA